VACTGVHGANRLASNSLLETVVFAHRAVQRLVDPPSPTPAPPEPHPDARPLPAGDAPDGPPTRQGVRDLMWRDVGIVRTGEGLERASAALRSWSAGAGNQRSRESYELDALLTCARLATEAALLREESRGAHFRVDHPAPDDRWRRHIYFRREAAPGAERVGR
jgi:L-aspartate oxidase